MSLFDNKDFEKVLDRMMHNDPMRWQGLMMDMETNKLTLEAFRRWLAADWYEKILLSEEFPEFEFMNDDMMILDMQHELLATLN
tara:strand:+ start:387 stop:638 length:252 start_codon:yes stop_codon:yes gene_type:complete